MNSMTQQIERGVRAHLEGNLEEATAAYLAVLDDDPDNATAHNNLGFVLSQQQRWPEALSHLRTALRLAPTMAMAHCNVGQVLAITGATEEGLAHLEQATSLAPDSVIAWDNLAKHRLLCSDFQGAEYAAIRAIKLQPQDAKLLSRLGMAVAAQRRHPEAIDYYRRALAFDPTLAETWVQLGMTYLLRNDLGSAEEALQTALSLNPADAGALRHLGLVKLATGRTAAAIECFSRAVELNPADAASRLDLAVLLLSQNRAEEAMVQFAEERSAVTETQRFQFYHALALQRTGHEEAANAQLLQLASSDGDYANKARLIVAAH